MSISSDDLPVFSDSEDMPTESGRLSTDLADGNLSSSDVHVSETELPQGYESDAQSPDNMLTDPEEYVVGQPEDDGDDVAEIDPDQLDEIKQPHADDYEAMKDVALPPIEMQPRILETVVNTWHIQNWRSLEKKVRGPIFEAGGYPWRILMFPTGNNVDSCSFYLEHGFKESQFPENWVCCIQFGLVLWNPKDPAHYVQLHAVHRFTKEEGDWGFTRFADLRKIFSPNWTEGASRPLVEDDAANMTAYVNVCEDETGVLWHNFLNYDSKAMTGYVGLKNQGATCYLNSLLQSLFFTNAFRKAVYQIPTQDAEFANNSAYTLQRLFYQMQTSTSAVSTNELTKSFGWETRHTFEQQDVQELSRKLMERLEEKMKGTAADNMLPDLFCGKLKTYISCIHVDYESSRVEDFWDIQLNVSGNKNIEDSFKDYIQVETMDGENQYMAGDNFKLQDARKGVIFQSFPEVLHLQLKRFEYDIDRDAMMKINDRYEFPETFDAAPYLAEDVDKSESFEYQLHGVLVHAGDLNAGHYYAYLKPTKDGKFYKFDDDKVTAATMRDVLEDNYGGDWLLANGKERTPVQKIHSVARSSSAYMLVYIRKSRLDHVLFPLTTEDIPSHLQKRLDEEQAMREARRKEREEAHLYLWARVITQQTFEAHGGVDLTYFEGRTDDPSTALSYKVPKAMPIKDFAMLVARDINVDPRRIRFWCMVNRQNKTVRPDQPILDENLTIDHAHSQLVGSKQTELRLWTEVAEEVTPTGDAIWPGYSPTSPASLNGANAPLKNDLIVLFLKWFDVKNQALKGVGHIYISKEKKVEDLVAPILKKMGWPERNEAGEKTQLALYEEIKPTMIEKMKAKQSLKAAELQDGDIICFQLSEGIAAPDSPDNRSLKSTSSLTNGSSIHSAQSVTSSAAALSVNSSDSTAGRTPRNSTFIEDAPSWYDYLQNSRVVRFLPYPKQAQPHNYEILDLHLSTRLTYEQLTTKVGDRLGVPGTHLRFFTVHQTTQNPKAVVKRNPPSVTLQQILTPQYGAYTSGHRNDALYYEVLDISLSELDTKKTLKITWLSEGITKEDLVDVLVPKNGIVADLIAGLIKKAKLEDEETKGPIRVFEVQNSKFYKELPREYSVVGITDYSNIYAERVPEEELPLHPDHAYISVYHFQTDLNKLHGVPFKFLIYEDEKFRDTKKRLEKRTGLKGKSFEKIKFAVIKRNLYGRPVYLTDDDVLWTAAEGDDALGLDHVDRTRQTRNGAGDLFLK